MLPVFFFFLYAAFAESLNEGDSCSLTNRSPGICVFLKNCQSVFDELKAGGLPDKICGFDAGNIEPIICCPTNSLNTTTSLPAVPSNVQGDGRGAIAKQKCAEYSQSVYVLKDKPTLAGNQQRVNVSQCVSTAQKLIVSGPKADPGEFPHMAMIGFPSPAGITILWCIGTLISETFVLTSAHCTDDREWGKPISVSIGNDVTPEHRRIVEIINHPEYKRSSVYHDIALLRLESPVPFNAGIRPACLHTTPTTEIPKVIATGWEKDSSSGRMKIALPIVDSKTCTTRFTTDGVNIWLPNGVVDDLLICAGSKNNHVCEGDRGGPLVIFSDKKYFCMYDVVGVRTVEKVCDKSGGFGIYARVYNYIPWIESVVWGQG